MGPNFLINDLAVDHIAEHQSNLAR